MVAAMMDRNDPNVKAYERWCGDYSPATESMARLAHSGSASFQTEGRQYLADRLGKEFLRYPGTREPQGTVGAIAAGVAGLAVGAIAGAGFVASKKLSKEDEQ